MPTPRASCACRRSPAVYPFGVWLLLAFRGVPPEREDFGMLCPCARCRNHNRLPRTKYEMQLDLGRNGFMPGYTVWVHHDEGKQMVRRPRQWWQASVETQPAKPSDDHAGGSRRLRSGRY